MSTGELGLFSNASKYSLTKDYFKDTISGSPDSSS